MIENSNSIEDNYKPSIHFFSTFEEMAEDNYAWLATLTPEQHLQNAVAHIKQIYAEELRRNPDLGTELIFEQ